MALSEKDDARPESSHDEEAARSSSKEESDSKSNASEDLVCWDGREDGSEDPNCPLSWSKFKKWTTVLIISNASTCVAYTIATMDLMKDLHASRIVVTLGLSLFVAGLGVSPMLIAPLSEFYGRRWIYILGMLTFTIFLIPCALATNIQTMLVARFIDGMAGSAFLSVAGGSISDLFSQRELQGPMAVFTASPFIGPSLGPIIAGFIVAFSQWRWIFYVLIIWSFVTTLAIVFFVPETYHPVLLQKKAKRLRKETGDEKYQAPLDKDDRSIIGTVLMACKRPFQLLAVEVMVLLLCSFTAVLLAILYLFFGAFTLVYGTNHHFNTWQIGLSFTGILVGMLIGVSTNPIWSRMYLKRLKKHEADGGGPEPEDRLLPAIVGGPLVCIGLFWFAWTLQASIHWIVSIIGSAIFGAGVILVYTGVFAFLVSGYPKYAASAMAANSFTRSALAAAFPLFGVQMYNNLGFSIATTVLACITLALAPFPYLFFKFGKRLRKNSRFAKPS